MRGDAVQGTLIFEQETEDGPTTIKGEVQGISEGKHGVAIHVFGDLSEGAQKIGEHFNPFCKNHGAPEDEERHVGSLGNIIATAEGTAKIHIEDKQVKLIGPYSIIGRSVAIGEKEDDLGKGGHPSSLTNGNVGAIVACGVVGIGA
jgi:Cu-Zn family superoxide dismutase